LHSIAAVVFTNDTTINPFETNYDGNDIVVSNCTLTVDGPHGFLSLLVGPGGTVTPSYSSNYVRFQADEPHTLTGTNPASLQSYGTLIAQTVTDAGNTLTYTQNVDYVMLFPGFRVIQIARTPSSSIPDGATVLVSYTVQSAPSPGFMLSITGNVQVAAGGVIGANGRGYFGGNGPGAGRTSAAADGSGGSYGGLGGTSSSNAVANLTYGLYDNPADLGSGGGNGASGAVGAPGGGAVKISAGGNINIDGAIVANGWDATNSRSGGGSGGSIWLIASSVSGAGTITANGGAGEPIHGGGGGGGRISIQANTNTFSGATTAYGGNGWQFGGAGTVFTSTSTGVGGAVLVDNGGRAGTNTLLTVNTGADVTLRTGVITTNAWSVGNLVIGSNAFLQVVPLTQLSINALGSVRVQPGGAILADRTGYAAGAGPGPGGFFTLQTNRICGGGGHGGYGGSGSISNAFGGNFYDSQGSPTQFGSGGGFSSSPPLSGSGGGAIRLNVSGALQIDGRLSANGGDAVAPSGGGGSGGSIWLTAGLLSGTGTIAANGGNGADSAGGGGSGGRISLSVNTNTFIGTLSAYGGSGANWGAAGPMLLQVNSALGATYQLIVDNGGHIGTNSALQAAGTTTGLIVRNGGVAVLSLQPLTFGSLLVGSNGWLTATASPNLPGEVNQTVTGNATIQHGGGIITDGLGSGPGLGQGAGRVFFLSPLYYIGGGGYGGYGGGTPTWSVGGNAYGSTTIPNLGGSGGGQLLPSYVGGAGGGWIRLTVNGTLQLDGRLSANGADGALGGGGSGGSIWLTLGKLSGSGSITANGGNGGSGGGGGRISITFNTNSFAGVLSAYGGGLTNWGGAGTIYLKSNSSPYALVLADNGGNLGTNTSLGTDIFTGSVDLTVGGGAVALPSLSQLWLHNVQVRSNSTLAAVAYGRASQELIALNATVDSGGALSADGAGYDSSQGPGAGSAGGGGGHGGFGALNPAGRGGAYDSIVSPNLAGSGGSGGAGGGVWMLNVTGTLTVNGRLSANGFGGDYNSGGGSGGTLALNVGTLAGTGVISASGGAGNGNAGGGGGGRIAITWLSNQFTGPITASGGNGMVAGGAGTVYLRPTNTSIGQLFVDNGGLVGTVTPLLSTNALPSSPFNLTLTGGASAMAIGALPLLSNLTVGTGAQLTVASGQSNLAVAVLGNVSVISNASISVAGRGYPQAQGPGAGATLNSKGAGGGYGGYGGAAASGAAGGTVYGAALQPVDRGSGGGAGANTFTGGSEGGGALRLTVGGTLNLSGAINANGNIGVQDDSGGGSGGSVWISAGRISGAGAITANGANGDLYGGGGGGGGRIALYSPANTFTGLVTTAGGAGANFGADGTLFVSGSFSPFQVLSSSPVGVVSNLVSFVDLTLSDTVNPYALSALGFTLFAHGGPPLPPGSMFATLTGPSSVRMNFHVQNTPGDYLFTVRSGITNLLGQNISQVYTGAFTIAVPTISGRVTDTNGVGVADVLLQPSDTFYGAATDPSGYYSLGVPPGWNGTITPSLGTSMFVPGFLSFANVTISLTNQNFRMVPTIAPSLSSTVSGGNFNVMWNGIAGVTYQAYSSTNLVDWQPVGAPLPGTNGLMRFVTPLDDQPLQFFRIQASD
jgi:hypothetical protein